MLHWFSSELTGLKRRGGLNAEEEQLPRLQETDPWLALFSSRRCRPTWRRDEQTGPWASTSWPSTSTRWRRSWSKWPVTWGGPALRSCTFQPGGQIRVIRISGALESKWAGPPVWMCDGCVGRLVEKEGSDDQHAGWISPDCRVGLLQCSQDLIASKSLEEFIFCLNKVLLTSRVSELDTDR